jgi:molybdate transport system substrate-binding protein
MRRWLRSFGTSAAAAFALALASVAAQSAELTLMTSGALAAPLRELLPAFERSSGTTLTVVSGGSVGGAPDSIPNRLQRGERADVLVMASSSIDDMIQAGRVVPGSRVDLVRSRIGIAVRAGTPKPDISTVEALKRTLLAAKSIAYSSSVSGVYVSTELFQRLGIAKDALAKGQKIDSEPVAAVVARGQAEIGFQQISELRPVAGVEVVGPLPDAVQRVTIFSAAIGTSAANRAGARALIEYLASPGAAPVFAESGLEPLAVAAGIRGWGLGVGDLRLELTPNP